MKDRIDDNKNDLGNGFDMAAKTLAILMALFVILPIASSYEVAINLSKEVSLNITQSLFNESNEKNITYYLQVKNEGSTLIKDINVTDILPPGVFYLVPNDLGKNEAPLLRCIVHNVDKTTNRLTWYIDRIHTGEYRWLNFTVQKRGSYINPSQNKVFSEGVALGYFIQGASLLTAVPFPAPKPAEGMRIADIELHSPVATEVVPDENASNSVSLEPAMPYSVPKPAEGMINADIEPPPAEVEAAPKEKAPDNGVINSMPSGTPLM